MAKYFPRFQDRGGGVLILSKYFARFEDGSVGGGVLILSKFCVL